MKISNKNFQSGNMKTSIFDVIILICLIAVGCNPTTYLSLAENNKEQIERQLNSYKHDELGAEVTLSLKDKKEIKGELLSVSDSMLIICTKHSATDLEITNVVYPTVIIRNNDIKSLTLKGNNFTWLGLAIGSVTFTGIGIWMGLEFNKGMDTEGSEVGFGILGLLVGAAVGGIVGYFLSTDDVILFEIPPDYNFSLLNPLTRYKDEEPEYLSK
jgi:small nuclear ribonucleoprotein (snRNP)-like protein